MAETMFVSLAGTLEPFFETGTEGVVWSLETNGIPGYAGLCCLENGDELLIYDESGGVAWQGVVDLEYDRHYRPYPTNPQYGQQEIRGRWVHGFQRNLEPDVWASAFFSRTPAIVRPKKRRYVDYHYIPGLLKALQEGVEATQQWLQAHPEHSKSLLEAVKWPWIVAGQKMGWPETQGFASERHQVEAWRSWLALQRAERALWMANPQAHRARMKSKFPTLEQLQAEQETWISYRLAHDSDTW